MNTYGKLNKELVKLILINQLKDLTSPFSLFVLNGESLENNDFQKLLSCSEFELGINIKSNVQDKKFDLRFVDIDSDELKIVYENALDLSTDKIENNPYVIEKIVFKPSKIEFVTDTYNIEQRDYTFKFKKINEPFINKVTLHTKDGHLVGSNGETLDFFLMANHKRLQTLKSKYSQVVITDKQLEIVRNIKWGECVSENQKKRLNESFEYCKNYKGLDWKMGVLLRELNLIFGY